MELEKSSELPQTDETIPGEIEGFPGDQNTEIDLPPEFCHYRDEGCELAESCLNCPFAGCIYDEPGGKQRWTKRLRAKEIARLHIMEGKKIKELSEMFGISQRTVQRVLKTVMGRTKTN